MSVKLPILCLTGSLVTYMVEHVENTMLGIILSDDLSLGADCLGLWTETLSRVILQPGHFLPRGRIHLMDVSPSNHLQIPSHLPPYILPAA